MRTLSHGQAPGIGDSFLTEHTRSARRLRPDKAAASAAYRIYLPDYTLLISENKIEDSPLLLPPPLPLSFFVLRRSSSNLFVERPGRRSVARLIETDCGLPLRNGKADNKAIPRKKEDVKSKEEEKAASGPCKSFSFSLCPGEFFSRWASLALSIVCYGLRFAPATCTAARPACARSRICERVSVVWGISRLEIDSVTKLSGGKIFIITIQYLFQRLIKD